MAKTRVHNYLEINASISNCIHQLECAKNDMVDGNVHFAEAPIMTAVKDLQILFNELKGSIHETLL